MILRVDWENNAEEWWRLARRDKRFSKRIHTWLNKLGGEELKVTDAEAENFRKIAKSIYGWDNGPRHADCPIIFVAE